MQAIEKTAVIESEIFFNAEEIAALNTVRKMFTVFKDTMEKIDARSAYSCLTISFNDKAKEVLDEEEIHEVFHTLNAFCQSTSVIISGEY